jgi:Ran GTPase-activating protein (RanGAP) involved in mRNA processing and transport
MPKGKIDKHIQTTKSVYNQLFSNVNTLSNNLLKTEQKENTILSLNCCDLRGKDLLMLLNSQFDISQLTILDLSNNSINYEGMRWLTFQDDLCYNLIELNLSENLLDHKAAKFLTRVEFHTLDILNISKNDLGPLGASILAEKGKFPNLRALNISENYLMKEGAKGLTNGPAFKYITILDISGNEINDYGFYLLSLGKFENLLELYLGSNKIGDDGIAYISNFKKLEVLDMNSNALTYKGVNNICGKYFKNIVRLNLDNNAIGVEGTFLITSYKENNLRSLSLVKNDICTKGAELISIQYLNKIESINISDNFINDIRCFFK